MSRMLSFVILLLILVAISTVFFRMMSGFLVPVFLAALFGVIFQPINHRISRRFASVNRYISAAITTFVVAFIVITPAALVIVVSGLEGLNLVNQLGDMGFRKRISSMRAQLDLEIPHREDLLKIERTLERLSQTLERGETTQIEEETLVNLSARAERLTSYATQNSGNGVANDAAALETAIDRLKALPPASLQFDDLLSEARLAFRRFKISFLGGPYRAWIKELINPTEQQVESIRSSLLTTKSPLVDFGGDTVSLLGRILVGTLVMLVTLFFIFADGPRLLDVLLSFSPLEEHYVRELLKEFDRASRAVVLATLLSALAQGLLAGIGYQFCGVGSVFLLTLLTTVLAMVPFLGAASVWICVCLWMYAYEGRTGMAIGFAVYGTVVVSGVDNIIKPLVLHGQSNLHPLLALLSILGGVQTIGPIGIIVGPMSVVFLQTLVRILHREYKAFENKMEVADAPPDSTVVSDELEDNE